MSLPAPGDGREPAGRLSGVVREFQHDADAGRLRGAAHDHHVRPHRQAGATPVLNAVSFFLIMVPGTRALIGVVAQREKRVAAELRAQAADG